MEKMLIFEIKFAIGMLELAEKLGLIRLKNSTWGEFTCQINHLTNSFRTNFLTISRRPKAMAANTKLKAADWFKWLPTTNEPGMLESVHGRTTRIWTVCPSALSTWTRDLWTTTLVACGFLLIRHKFELRVCSAGVSCTVTASNPGTFLVCFLFDFIGKRAINIRYFGIFNRECNFGDVCRVMRQNRETKIDSNSPKTTFSFIFIFIQKFYQNAGQIWSNIFTTILFEHWAKYIIFLMPSITKAD